MKSKKNKIISISIIVFIVVVVLCTYFSKTINNMLLPEVTVAYLKPGTIGDGFQGTGTVEYENTHKIYSMQNWSIKEIDVKLNQSVKKGDVLAKVDNDAINLKEREEKAVIMQLQDEIDTLKKAQTQDQNKIKEDQYKLDTENSKYSAIRKGITADGSILSDVDGKIVSISSKNNQAESNEQEGGSAGTADGNSSDSTNVETSSDALFEIVSDTPSLCVKFTVSAKDADKFSIGTKLNIINAADDENSKLTASTAEVIEKKYKSNTDEYEVSANISSNNGLKQQDKVTIELNQNAKKYNNVIQKSCLVEENGLTYVYQLSSNANSLGGESSVKKVQVQVVAFDSINCSIKSTSNSELSGGIVTNTSKPIEDNDEVKCTFTASR